MLACSWVQFHLSTQSVLAKRTYCSLIPLTIPLRQRHQRAGNEENPCQGVVVKTVTLKKQEGGIRYVTGKTSLVKTRGILCASAFAPSTGPGSLSKSEIKRKAKEIIQASGVDTAEYFAAVVKPNPTGLTFRKQSEIWLQNSQSRKRNPIGNSYAATIQGALDKWILPVIGDLPLGSVDNLAVKPLVDKMSTAGLSARTANKYVEFVQQVVASLKAANGEPIHNKKWNAEVMDLPIVKHSEQKRPSLKASTISELVKSSSDQERALYVLLAATGMRVSEALAVETRHFTNDGRTINVEQQVEKDAPRIANHLKTPAAKRQIDLHPDVAEYLRAIQQEKLVCCFIRRTAHRISTETWKNTGSRLGS